MDTKHIEPDELVSAYGVNPMHAPDDAVKLSSLVDSMLDDGWHGRPLLVTRGGQALTGSHRVEAARQAGIDVPVVWATDCYWGDCTDDADRLAEFKRVMEEDLGAVGQ